MEDKQVQTEGGLISNLTTESILILDIQVTMVVIILAFYSQELMPVLFNNVIYEFCILSYFIDHFQI